MAQPNHPPYIKDLSGPSVGKVGVEYRFSTTVLDLDNDNVSCIWDRGDGTTSDWQGPFANGTTTNIFHTWTTDGIYDIKVKPKDQHGLEGEWSASIMIAINRSLTTTFNFGQYSNLTMEGNYIIITAINIKMFTTRPFQFLHDIAGQKVTFLKNNLEAVIFPHFIIGIINVLF